MDSYASAPAFDVARWRTATIVASAVAAIELVALLAIGSTLLGRSVAHHVREAAVNKVAGAPPVRQNTAPGAPKLARSDTGVLVLNGNGVAGAAATVAARVRGRGYIVSAVGNADAPSPRTIVMYRPGFRAEGLRLGRDLHAPLVTPLDGMRTRDLMGAQLVLLLGT